MADYITIDGGTTNTRISLVRNNTVTAMKKYNIGARIGIDDRTILTQTLKKGISEILTENSLCENEITAVLASGMITSEFGLFPLEHITAPAGIKELHKSMEKVALADITQIPFYFVRGVKLLSPQLEKTDMMRGEETELVGIMQKDEGECVYILPGSHSKIIFTDNKGSIIDFSTMLTGEMLHSLSQHTILKDAVNFGNAALNEQYLLKGYDYCKKNTINEALFKVRVLKNVFKCSPDETYSFFMGIAFCGEVEKILCSNPRKIIIGGKSELKEALGIILRKNSTAQIVCIDDKKVQISATMGMIKVYEYNEKI